MEHWRSVVWFGITFTVCISAGAVQFEGRQTAPGEWTYDLTYDPSDNYAICQPIATITLRGLTGVTAALPPQSTDFDPPGGYLDLLNLDWNAEVMNGGSVVRWTHVGPGTGNFGTEKHVYGFRVSAPGVIDGAVTVVTDGFELDEWPACSDRDITTTTAGPVSSGPQPICWWRFDEGSGQVVADSVGALDGVLGTTDSPEPEDPEWYFEGGARDWVLSFDHAQRVFLGDSSEFDFEPTDPFTLSFWVFKTADEPAGHLVGKRDGCGAGEMNYQFVDESVAQNSFHFNSQAGGFVRSGRVLSPWMWNHVAATYAPGGDLVLYINGREVGRGLDYNLGWKTTAPLLLGTVGTCFGFGGLMDDVRLWDQTLSEDQTRGISGFTQWDDFESGDTSGWTFQQPPP